MTQRPPFRERRANVVAQGRESSPTLLAFGPVLAWLLILGSDRTVSAALTRPNDPDVVPDDRLRAASAGTNQTRHKNREAASRPRLRQRRL